MKIPQVKYIARLKVREEFISNSPLFQKRYKLALYSIAKLQQRIEGLQQQLEAFVNQYRYPSTENADRATLINTALNTDQITADIEPNEYFEQLWKCIVSNTYTDKGNMSKDYWKVKDIQRQFFFALSQRYHSVKAIPQFIFDLSMCCEYYGCPKPLWNILARLRIVVSQEEVNNIIDQAMGDPISNWFADSTSISIAAVVGDNCFFSQKHFHKTNTYGIDIINSTELPVILPDHSTLDPFISDVDSAIQIVENKVSFSVTDKDKLTADWKSEAADWIKQHSHLLQRSEDIMCSTTKIMVRKPLLHASPSESTGVLRFLEQLRRDFILGRGIR